MNNVGPRFGLIRHTRECKASGKMCFNHACRECLSPRQHTILTAIWDGKTHQKIAHELGISIKTVEFHIMTVRNKWEVVQGAVPLMREGLKRGYLTIEENNGKTDVGNQQAST